MLVFPPNSFTYCNVFVYRIERVNFVTDKATNSIIYIINIGSEDIVEFFTSTVYFSSICIYIYIYEYNLFDSIFLSMQFLITAVLIKHMNLYMSVFVYTEAKSSRYILQTMQKEVFYSIIFSFLFNRTWTYYIAKFLLNIRIFIWMILFPIVSY